MEIKILGTGCSNCRKLESNVRKAISEVNIDAEVIKVEDLKSIMSYGVIRTPAIVINNIVRAYGKVSSVEEIKNYLS